MRLISLCSCGEGLCAFVMVLCGHLVRYRKVRPKTYAIRDLIQEKVMKGILCMRQTSFGFLKNYKKNLAELFC